MGEVNAMNQKRSTGQISGVCSLQCSSAKISHVVAPRTAVQPKVEANAKMIQKTRT